MNSRGVEELADNMLCNLYHGEKERIEKLGWTIKIEADSSVLLLLSRFKNGKLRQIPDVELSYNEFVSDWYFDEDKGEVVERNIRKSFRPWKLRAKRRETSTFSDFATAKTRFMIYAAKFAPQNQY